jgi:hypothetical protein
MALPRDKKKNIKKVFIGIGFLVSSAARIFNSNKKAGVN